jgi:uncharacterized protein (TIGR02147 family)
MITQCITNTAVEQIPFYRQRLQQELTERIARNPGYSLRAFARSLAVEPGALSQILSGKRSLSDKLVERITLAMGLSPEERRRFVSSLGSAKRASGLKRISPTFRNAPQAPPDAAVRELSSEAFRVVADWYHYAILELTFVQGFQSSPRWIASRLGISQAQASSAIQRLMALELLEERGGKLVKVQDRITTADKSLTTAAHRLRQRQVLEKSAHSLQQDPLAERNHSAMTVAIDETRLPEAKRRIEAFIQELTTYLESGPQTRVYELAVSLFPLQAKEKNP